MKVKNTFELTKKVLKLKKEKIFQTKTNVATTYFKVG